MKDNVLLLHPLAGKQIATLVIYVQNRKEKVGPIRSGGQRDKLRVARQLHDGGAFVE